MNKVQDLAEEHWEYIESLLEQHGESDDVVDKIGFHYKTAFVHGYKHGWNERIVYKGKAKPSDKEPF